MHVPKSIISVLIFCLICTSTGYTSTAIEKMLFPDCKLMKILAAQKMKNGLSKASSLEWKKVRSLSYMYNNGSSSDLKFTNRDTVVYNSDGMIKLYKVSKASRDWFVDSLISVDSLVAIDTNTYEKYTFDYSSGLMNFGIKDEFRYSDNRKCIVSIRYSLDINSMKWVPSTKDSIVLTAPYDYVKYLLEMSSSYYEFYDIVMPGNGIINYSYDNYMGYSNFEYDTISKQWNLNSTLNFQNALKTPTSITGIMKEKIGTQDSATMYVTYNFKSNSYSYSNLSNMVMLQRKPDQTGYDSLYKISMDFKSGEFTKFNWIVWDDTLKKWNSDYYNIFCKLDSHNNDTSSLVVYSFFPDPDSSLTKTKRTYDIYGNNIESIVSSGTNEANLTLNKKTITTYVQIDVPVKHNRVVSSVNNMHLTFSNYIITISAPNITEIALYNGSGRLMQSRKQVGANILNLDLRSNQKPVTSGVYFARVKYDGKWSDFKLNINK